MAGKVLQLFDLITPDQLGCSIANMWVEWNTGRQFKVSEWREVREYIYATDTRHTTAGKLPWSNSTTLPKLTQIRDNLYANYIASMFPKRKWLNWEGSTGRDEDAQKTKAIKDYMMWAVNQPQFKEEVKKLVLDYIDYGNCFVTSEWVDESVEDELTGIKTGFIGPRPVRISPHDIVFNPIAPSFSNTPKITRSLMTIGEAKEILERMSSTETDKELAKEVFDYAMGIRSNVTGMSNQFGATDVQEQDRMFQVDGFQSFQYYLRSDYMELLTFQGDIYDKYNNQLLKNYMIVVIDRHKIAIKKPNPFPLAGQPIHHAGWRIRQDNLWAMGPLDNLVGLQYRLDHITNMKSDILDLTTYPVIKIKGSGTVSDFEWGPMEKIFVDSDGDVEMMAPDVQALQLNVEEQGIQSIMEEMAGSPKEAMGFRTPGEKTAFEVQRLENAASRIFQNKISQFEEQIIEPLLNDMLVLAKQYLSQADIRIIDDEFGSVYFDTITKSDLSANGRLKPIAARHFAEQAELVQNLTNFSQSALGQMQSIQQHFSSVKMAEMIEDALNLEEYDVYQPFVGISEQAEAQRLAQTAQEQLMNEMQTPSGLTPDDYSQGGISANDPAFQSGQPTQQTPQEQQGNSLPPAMAQGAK
jgi:hypothetical protein